MDNVKYESFCMMMQTMPGQKQITSLFSQNKSQAGKLSAGSNALILLKLESTVDNNPFQKDKI